MNQIVLLLQLYFAPSKSFSRILDEGRFLVALIAAVAVTLALQIPRASEYQTARAAQFQAARDRVIRELPKDPSADPEAAAERIHTAIDQEMARAAAEAGQGRGALLPAADRFTSADPSATFSPLVAIAICFVPAVILVLTFWDNLGGFGTVLFRDYMPLLVCCLFAWTAPYLLLFLANLALQAAHLPFHNDAVLFWAASAWFVVLAAIAIRTLFGTSYAHGLGASCAGWLAGTAGLWLYGMFGNVTAYLASPFVLYYLYVGLGSQLTGIGSGLRARQRFKRQLKIATMNPRDADAHCQLGLIYLQRRQYEQAADRFRRAIEADPNEAEAHFQLGRIARIEGRYPEAVTQLHATLHIDDKHSSSEAWRELGAALVLGGNPAGALEALDTYAQRREYDPEGLVWRGRALIALNRPPDARTAFQQAIESVRTMPAARRRQVAAWGSEANKELKKLPA